jgi:hypothetical protein
MNVNDELGKMGKDETVTYFKVAYHPSVYVEGLKEIQENLQ